MLNTVKIMQQIPEIIPTYTPNTLILRYAMDNNTINQGTIGVTGNGTLVGSAMFSSLYVKRGTYSLYTPSTGSYVTVPKIYLTDGTNSNGFTISFWMIKPVIAPTGDIMVFGTGSNKLVVNIYGGDAVGNYNVYFNINGIQVLSIAVGIGESNTNWRFFAFTLSKTGTGISYGYNNSGYHYGQTSNAFTYPTAAFTNNIIGNANVYIDDVRMYNYVLTRANIDGIYSGTF